MSVWANNIIMLTCLILCFCRCLCKSKENHKELISEYYCEKKKDWKGQYNSFLWSIERKNKPKAYLFGTVHAPYDLVWRYVPSNVKEVLEDSTHVYTELNIRDENVINAIHECRQIPEGKTLKDVLPAKLFDKFMKNLQRFQLSRKRWIRKYAKPVGLTRNYRQQAQTDLYQHYAKLKPVWMINKILQEWNKFYVKSQFRRKYSLDAHIVHKAIDNDSYKGGIEEVSMHCDPMNELSEDKVNLALNITLRSHEQKNMRKHVLKQVDIRRVVNLYKCGNPLNTSDLVTLFSSFVDEELRKRLKEIDDYLSRELVYKRDVKIADRIASMLDNEKYDEAKMFFAIGAAHLLGKESVVSFLRNKGYTVRHVEANEKIPTSIQKKIEDKNKIKVWKKAFNMTKWISEIPNEEKPKVIIINKEVKKTYVYYYNRSVKPSITSSVSLIGSFITLMIILVI